jgi:hypothetical protein
MFLAPQKTVHNFFVFLIYHMVFMMVILTIYVYNAHKILAIKFLGLVLKYHVGTSLSNIYISYLF